MTAEGLQKLKEELQYLETVERPRVIAAIAEAREKGDLSENAEYDAAKEEQGILESKIAMIKGKIVDARIIDETDINTDVELGRSVVAQCGSLITRVLYVKEGTCKRFAIVDAGMTDLIRPALYQAYHRIENISSDEPEVTYDVVGPVCESSDVFGKSVDLNATHRGDFIAIRSAGAYGEIMASQYNCRQLPKGYLSEEV